MKYLAVKNFEELQHYKNRNPTWIKLYTSLLDDYAFLMLSEANQRHLLMLWLVASRSGNKLPSDPKLLAQAIKAKGRVDVKALVASGFLRYRDADENSEDASKLLARSAPPASTLSKGSAIPEGEGEKRRGEREGEKEGEETPPPPILFEFGNKDLADRVLSRFASDEQRRAVTALFAEGRLDGTESGWLHYFNSLFDGLNSPGGKGVTSHEIVSAVSELNTQSGNITTNRMNKFLAVVMDRERGTGARRKDGGFKTSGERMREKLLGVSA